MYAELFGIQGASAAVESAAQWVQWVQSGLMSGAAENEATIRYNLDQFWRAKAAAYPNEDGAGQAQLDRLDSFAYAYWNALETGKTYSASPTYWEYYKKSMLQALGMSVTPDRPEAITAAANAAAAAAGMQASAQRTNNTAFSSGVSTLGKTWESNAPKDLSASNQLWAMKGNDLLGIPIWAWIAGAAALGFMILAPRGK